MTSQPVQELYRYCPRCGSENPIRGAIPFRCPECRYAEFFGPVGAVGGLIINAADELLLVRRACQPGKGKWGLPGGFVDRDETIEAALAREIREETQLRIVRSEYLTSFPNHYDYQGVVVPVIDLFFLCRVAATEPLVLKQDELESHEWVRPSRAHLDAMAFPSNRRAVEKWLAGTA